MTSGGAVVLRASVTSRDAIRREFVRTAPTLPPGVVWGVGVLYHCEGSDLIPVESVNVSQTGDVEVWLEAVVDERRFEEMVAAWIAAGWKKKRKGGSC